MVRHVTNFIEEKRAALRLFKPANALPHSACKRALFVTKQFRLDQFRRNRRHVDRDEWSGFTVTQIVDRLRHKLFTRAGFA